MIPATAKKLHLTRLWGMCSLAHDVKGKKVRRESRADQDQESWRKKRDDDSGKPRQTKSDGNWREGRGEKKWGGSGDRVNDRRGREADEELSEGRNQFSSRGSGDDRRGGKPWQDRKRYGQDDNTQGDEDRSRNKYGSRGDGEEHRGGKPWQERKRFGQEDNAQGGEEDRSRNKYGSRGDGEEHRGGKPWQERKRFAQEDNAQGGEEDRSRNKYGSRGDGEEHRGGKPWQERKRFGQDDNYSRDNKNKYENSDNGGRYKNKWEDKNDNEKNWKSRDNGSNFRRVGSGRFEQKDDKDNGNSNERKSWNNRGDHISPVILLVIQSILDLYVLSFPHPFPIQLDNNCINFPIKLKSTYSKHQCNNFTPVSVNFENTQGLQTSVESGDTWDDEPKSVTVVSLVTDLPSAVIKVGDTKTVEIVYAVSPENFYVQVTPDNAKLIEMMDRMALEYGEGTKTALPLIKPGAICVARYSVDEMWYRGVVKSVGDTTALVSFPDYGNMEDVPLTDIMGITHEFSQLPVQGIKCALLASLASSSEWSEDEINNFVTLTELNEIEAHFVCLREECFKVVLKNKQTGEVINEKFGASSQTIETAIQDAKPTVKQFVPQVSSFRESTAEYVDEGERFLEPQVPLSENIDVIITWFISPEEFYCQSLKNSQEIKSMMTEIQLVYCRSPRRKKNLDLGSPVIAKFRSDNVFYRAEIFEKIGESFIVKFVDFGNKDIFTKFELWDIEKQFMVLPKQAIHSFLKDIKPAQLSWPVGVSEIDSYFNSEKFNCMFHTNVDGRFCATLSQNGKNVGDELVSKGLAIMSPPQDLFVYGSTCDNGTGETTQKPAIDPPAGVIRQITCYIVTRLTGYSTTHASSMASNIQQRVFFSHTNLLISIHTSPKNVAPLSDDQLVLNALCISSPDSEQWYRAMVLDCTNTSGVLVNYLDYGDTDEVSKDKLLEIPASLASFPGQALECSLTGIDLNPPNSDLEEQFKEFLEDQDVIMHVDSITENRLNVTLYDTDGKKFELINHLGNETFQVDPLCPQLIRGQAQVWVSHVEGTKLYLQTVKDADVLAVLLEQLFSFYETESQGTALDANVGQLCAAKSSKDDGWYRAKVLSVSKDDACVVFLDYGNSETIPLSNLRVLDVSFHVPNIMSFCVILPVEPTVPIEEFTEKVNNLTFEKEFVASFILSEGKWLAELVHNDCSLSAQLVSLNFATRITGTQFATEQVISDELLAQETKLSVFLSHIESPALFWVQNAGDAAAIEAMQFELQTKADDLQIIETLPDEDTLLAALYDESWYRAKVLETDNNLITVVFVDYGNTDVIDITSGSLRTLPDELKQNPGFAIKCKFSLEPVEGSEWSAESMERFESLLESEDPLTVEILSGEEVKMVNMFSSDKSIADILVVEGFALLTSDIEGPIPPEDYIVIEGQHCSQNLNKIKVQDIEQQSKDINKLEINDSEQHSQDINEVEVKDIEHNSQDTNEIGAEDSEQHSQDTNEVEVKNSEHNSQDTNDVEVEDNEHRSQNTNEVEVKNSEHNSQDTNEIEAEDSAHHSQNTNEVEVEDSEHCSQNTNEVEVKDNEHHSQNTNEVEVGDSEQHSQDTNEVEVEDSAHHSQNTKEVEVRDSEQHSQDTNEVEVEDSEQHSQDTNEVEVEDSAQHSQDTNEVEVEDSEQHSQVTIKVEVDIEHNPQDINKVGVNNSEQHSQDTTEVEVKDSECESQNITEVEVKHSEQHLQDINEVKIEDSEQFLQDNNRLEVKANEHHSQDINEVKVEGSEQLSQEIVGVEDSEQHSQYGDCIESLNSSLQTIKNDIHDKPLIDHSKENYFPGESLINKPASESCLQIQNPGGVESQKQDFPLDQEDIDEATVSAVDTTENATVVLSNDFTLHITEKQSKINGIDESLEGTNSLLNNTLEMTKATVTHKTEHTEKIIKQISVEMKKPNSLPCSPIVSRSDKIVPGSISRGISQEEIMAAHVYNRSLTPKLSHSEKIVPGSISRGDSKESIYTTQEDLSISLPTTPRRLHTDAPKEESIHYNTPKLDYADRIVPGSISRGTSEEYLSEVMRSPKKPHSEKIVRGSVVTDESVAEESPQADNSNGNSYQPCENEPDQMIGQSTKDPGRDDDGVSKENTSKVRMWKIFHAHGGPVVPRIIYMCPAHLTSGLLSVGLAGAAGVSHPVRPPVKRTTKWEGWGGRRKDSRQRESQWERGNHHRRLKEHGLWRGPGSREGGWRGLCKCRVKIQGPTEQWGTTPSHNTAHSVAYLLS
uniref:Tudor domain-containing protein n=1 Tax=Timema shepardi TaxID=629360 RepID=A0A7R9ANQ0_TIMSH|nr:unnamed protein product [Timema shepardi]